MVMMLMLMMLIVVDMMFPSCLPPEVTFFSQQLQKVHFKTQKWTVLY